MIDNEIFRIKQAVTSNSLEIFRSVLGSPRQTHVAGSVVRRIKVTPVELRRNSIIRASGHTFEYLGFGPGNYSTSLPDKQDRTLSKTETFLAQSTKTDGGLIVYTGMNSDGDFFAGNKKINSATGKEETFDTPVPTNTGEKNTDQIVNITETQKLFVEGSIRVEGGRDKNNVSEFDGPVVFNNKVTTNADIEANSIYLQGDEEISRKLSITDTKPTTSGNYGDIEFNSEPSKYDFIGWTYVTENKWEPFGWIGEQGVGISSGGTYVGFSTLLNLVATGFTFGVTYDANSGVSTITWDADPRIGIYTGVNAANFLGRVKNINFVGGGVTVIGNTDVGIATIILDKSVITGSSPGEPYNSLQWNNNDTFDGTPIAFYDPNLSQIRFGSSTNVTDSTFFNSTGSVGFGSTQPTAKVEIVADNETSLYIKTAAGTDIVKIENGVDDTTPFIIDGSGNVGINTGTTLATLDVVGNTAITGEVRIYESDRSSYVGLKVLPMRLNLTFSLPTLYGDANQVLTDNGTGKLSWTNVSRQNVTVGTGLTISNVTSDGLTNSTITNTGVTRIIAGTGVSVSPTSGTGDVTITATATGGTTLLYPFTTRGFGMVL